MAQAPGLRPTPDRVRETVFNWLMPMIEGSHCLDLFAGSGALGLEAASRGAASVCLLEREPRVLSVLRDNVARLDAGDFVQAHGGDAMTWLWQPPPRRFDLVFVDPPYADALAGDAIALLRSKGWLADDAWLYTEWPHGRPAPIPDSPWRAARAGRVAYALYRDAHRPAG